jgi:hypothetical protein
MSFLLLLICTLQWSWRKAQNRFGLEARWDRERVEVGGRRRSDPNNVRTCEQMNNNNKKFRREYQRNF